MADLKKLKGTGKKANRFGAPPTPEEVSTTLEAPESAPSNSNDPIRKGRAKTGRTVSWGTKVAPNFPRRIKKAAFDADMPINELLEKWLADHENKNS